MTKEKKVLITKLVSLGSALVIIGLTIYLSSGFTQSRFVFKRLGTAMVFFDKYVDRSLRATILDRQPEVTSGFMDSTGILPAKLASEPYAYFIADRTYGILSSGDPLTRRYMRDAPGPDFVMLRSIGENFFANELVTTSLASSDGRYVFLTTSPDWEQSLLHAWVHALAARNLPEGLAEQLNPSGNWDAKAALQWRFFDETVALFASDLYVAGKATTPDQAWEQFGEQTWSKYNAPDSELRQKEYIMLRITFDYPQRSANYYQKANDFAVYLLKRLGREQFSELLRAFLTGSYSRLDDLFRPLGGFEATLEAWQGDTRLPQ